MPLWLWIAAINISLQCSIINKFIIDGIGCISLVTIPLASLSLASFWRKWFEYLLKLLPLVFGEKLISVFLQGRLNSKWGLINKGNWSVFLGVLAIISGH